MEHHHSCEDALDDYVRTSRGGTSSGRWLEFNATGPKKLLRGWIITDIDDLGEGQSELCQMCLRERPRYIHLMERDNEEQDGLVARYFKGASTVRVGCICAAWMSGAFDKLLDKHGLERDQLSVADYGKLQTEIREACVCFAVGNENRREKQADQRSEQRQADALLARASETLNKKRDMALLHAQNEQDGNPSDEELVVSNKTIERDHTSEFLLEVAQRADEYGKGKRRAASDRATRKRSSLEQIKAMRASQETVRRLTKRSRVIEDDDDDEQQEENLLLYDATDG